jgi:16S rRNA (cytosine967-C5)-methyltransferase
VTARYLAAAALERVEAGGYGNLVLDAELKKCTLSAQDRAFASAIFYTVLEHRNTLDYALDQFLKKPAAKLDPPVRAVLRSALAQIWYLHTPPSAAVNEAVKLTRAFGKSSAAGMVNAVLRRAAAFDPASGHFADETERLSVLESVSGAVAAHFLRYYPADAQAILAAAGQAQPTEIRVNPLRTTAADLAKRLAAEGAHTVQFGGLPNCLLVEFAGSPADTPAFREGLFHVEGRTSQLAALAVGAEPGDKVVDLCAAPGGKTLTLAQEMEDRGTLYACDVTPNRVSLIEKALAHGGIRCGCALCADASVFNPALAQADRILADVPCSGLGILRKKPDIRYKELTALPQLTALQRAILENAAKSLKIGGRLVYSTCTLNPEENENQIAGFLAAHPDFAVITPEFLPDTMEKGPCGALSLPNRTGMDGFFICTMEKREWKKDVFPR